MLSEPLYELNDVSYHYHCGKPALHDVNLVIHPGEKIVLLGPNGCGKSTLQKMLAGLYFPVAGQFLAFGHEISAPVMRDVNFATAFRRKVGFVFQNSDAQIFCASVLDEVMFGPLALGMSYADAKQRAEAMLDYIGIAALANHLPHHLSGGEKKKVALAAILVVNPEVLILDEPTNGLDPRTQRWVIDTINELNNRGKTIIIATHNLEIVPELANRVIVMGETHTILADDTPCAILGNRQLLLQANLIDERYHLHLHGEDKHVHVHKHC